MRVKSHWFKGGPKSPEEVAGAAGIIAWRIALQYLKSMRKAGFEIEVGPRYFEFLAEMLVFLVMLGDRIAYRHFDEESRIAFTTKLANKCGEILADNQAELLGGNIAEYKATFISRFNEHADAYSMHGYEKDAENFSFVRELGLQLQDVVDERDRQWVIDQVVAHEGPEAISTFERAMPGLLGLEQKPRRSGHGGGE